MKLLTTFTSALVALILCAREISAVSSIVIGDIRIESSDRNGNFYCDGLICPENTTSCEVIKHNDPNDFQQLIRLRKCLSYEGTVLKDQLVRDPNRYNENVNIHVNSGGGASISSGRKLTPEEERELQEYLDDVQKGVASQVAESMRNLNEALRPLQDGSFLAGLQSRFGADSQNGGYYGPTQPFSGQSRGPSQTGDNVDEHFGTDAEDSVLNEPRRPVLAEFRRPSQAERRASNVRRRFGSASENDGFYEPRPPFPNESVRPAQSRSYYRNENRNFGTFFDSSFHDDLRPLLDGSFAENLRNNINNNVRESLKGFFVKP